ncbi:MAG TPA: NAD(P)/FAD-dependent oxidoreductase [Solirubrobacterales bacterium]|nr:NAD(P)/FAD-dependent oxidoreductase [Solirubrobacterales bacterium]
MARSVDAVVIGSGHNGLVAAAYLARAGWEVEVLERNPEPGGAVATEALTEPGFLHDTFSSWHPLFHLSAAYAELGDELRSRGLDYVNCDDVVTATLRRDGSSVVAHRDPAPMLEALSDADAAAYGEDLGALGAQMDIVGELLGTELHSAHATRLAAQLARRLGRREAASFLAQVTGSARGWLAGRFEGDEVATLFGPWVLHLGLTPDQGGGGFQLLALAGAVHEVGMPVVKGGSAKFVDAFVSLIEANGGTVRTGVEAERIEVRGGRAAAVVAGGEEIAARRAVIANTTPTQLYGTLLAPTDVPQLAARQAARFRYASRAGTQIHLALSEPPRWRGDPRLADAAIVHLSDGIDAVSLSCAQAQAGLLPAEPTIVCGQPTALDPSRAPDGKAILWIQLQEVPYSPTGDAAGEIDVGDGTWTPELEAAYADRIIDRLARQIENLPDAIIGRAVLSPRTLEERNPNFVRGDIYSGATDLAQSYLWRPLPAFGSHATPVDGLYHCGASTHPGPGLNAASGRIVARRLLRPPLRRRLGARLGLGG